MLNGGSMVWGFCVYFVYMIPLETDVLRKHRFHQMNEEFVLLAYLSEHLTNQRKSWFFFTEIIRHTHASHSSS